MTTKTHSTLTGSDLHEPKGVSTATLDQVYVADGAGSGSWQKIDFSNLLSVANPFGASLFHVREQQSNGGASSSGGGPGAALRTLNVPVTNEIPGANLSGNSMIMPAGSYYIQAEAVAGDAYFVGANSTAARLYLSDDSHGQTLAYSLSYTNSFQTSDPSIVIEMPIYLSMSQRFTLSSESSLTLRTWSSFNIGAPKATSSGMPEVYADVKIWKVL